ncbi:methyltransferase-like protein 27 isoform X4 [Brachyhypopomus gauderio]|uniref:methyltransferase-like protein 27 isoform X4 n=1 Tax=Brachyhypopomus gauderio TaxID=698409 RepID=UPI0040419DBF
MLFSYLVMASSRTFADVRDVILSAHTNVGLQSKIGFYSTWAENYEQDVALLDYRAPHLAAECITKNFKGDKARAIILDVACGTGLVSAHLKKLGFKHFVGIDGCAGMLDLARKTGLFQELKQCMLGQDSLLEQDEMYDIVVIVGALSVGQVPVTVIEQLWRATKPGRTDEAPKMTPRAQKISASRGMPDQRRICVHDYKRQCRKSRIQSRA